jgi:quercetin dioxygenase-like cupin family protein
MFLNKKNGPSFNVHTDPVEVIIECLDGVKHMEVEGNKIKLNRGQSLQIPANTEHKALNYEKALMISYGIHDTETLDGLRENDRDLQP